MLGGAGWPQQAGGCVGGVKPGSCQREPAQHPRVPLAVALPSAAVQLCLPLLRTPGGVAGGDTGAPTQCGGMRLGRAGLLEAAPLWRMMASSPGGSATGAQQLTAGEVVLSCSMSLPCPLIP